MKMEFVQRTSFIGILITLPMVAFMTIIYYGIGEYFKGFLGLGLLLYGMTITYKELYSKR